MRDSRIAQSKAWEQHHRATPEQIEDAHAVARAVAVGPADVARLKSAEERLESQRPGIWHAFHDAFVLSVRETPVRRAGWAKALGQAFMRAQEKLSGDLQQKKGAEELKGASREWQQRRDPFSVWSERDPDIYFHRGDVWSAAHLLIQVQPGEGLSSLDTLPFPGLMKEILALFFLEDRELIEELIQAAPPAFDEQGAWLPNRSVAALLAIDLVTEHARTLHEALSHPLRAYGPDNQKDVAKQALEDIERRELPAWMARAFGLLIQRPDGMRIALAYLAHLSRQKLVGRGLRDAGAETWTAHGAALGALVATLTGVSVGVTQVREGWQVAERIALDRETSKASRLRVRRRSAGNASEREGEGARTLRGEGLPFLLGAALLLGDNPAKPSELEAFWAWFRELLDGRDPGLSLINHGTSRSELPQRFGFLLSRLPDPDVLLREAYLSLEAQRRRALFAFRYEDHDLTLASDLLLRVGVSAAANWFDRVRTGAETDASRALFFWIYDQARRLWLTAVRDTGEAQQAVLTCFAFMPFLFGDSLGEALKRVVPPIASDMRVLPHACVNLRQNGVGAAKLLALVHAAGADLVASLRDAHQWAQLTGREEAFPEHLQQLSLELGIDFASPARTPESDVAGLREAFAESVPWGAALLSRLEADGCTDVRALRLDEPGATWCLQTTLPDAIRDRFGLSPDIRILAVNGHVRGHDLRVALEEPEGSGQVDPDLLVVASDRPEQAARLPRLSGPFGQRAPWLHSRDRFPPLADCLQEQLPSFDLFACRDPVRGRAFIGRRREVDAIAARLLSGQAVGVFGLRKVGKSSLLQAVTAALDPAGGLLATLGSQARTLPHAPTEALVVWLDVQSLVVRTRDALAERLFDGLAARLHATGISPATHPRREGSGLVDIAAPRAASEDVLDNLRRLLETTLARPDIPCVCFVIDEYDLLFEGYGGEPAVGGVEQIFALVRSLAQPNGRVSLALVGRDPIFVGQPHINGFTNPLLGWVEPFHLGPLSDEDATLLLQRLGRRVGIDMDAATVDLALRWTGGHPLLLREFGSARREAGQLSLTVPLLRDRDAVHTICGEIEVLMQTRYPDSLALLRALVDASESEASSVATSSGGRALKVLFDFGLVRGTSEAPWVPHLYRDVFRTSVPESKRLQRSRGYGT